MMTRSVLLWTVALAVGVWGAETVVAQDKPAPEVVEEDLGDGFRAVSINGGPPAVIDDRTGLIFKEIHGQPAIVDKTAGAILVPGKDGELVVKFYGGKGGSARTLGPKKLDRMKAFMKRVLAHGGARKRLEDGRKKGDRKTGPGKTGDGAKAIDPKTARASLLARYLKLLGVAGEEAEAITSLLVPVLNKQDEIRRSSVDLSRVGKKRPAIRTTDLPNAIRKYLQIFGAVRRGKPAGDALQTALPAYRAARTRQDAELAARRGALREVLTPSQEATLVAVGVLR